MTCEEAMILISGSIDGENTPEEDALLQAHLDQCPACSKLLEAYRQVDAGIAALEADPPAALASGVMERIKVEAGHPKPSRRARFGSWIAAAAAAVLVLAIGTQTFPLPKTESDQPAGTVSSVRTTVEPAAAQLPEASEGSARASAAADGETGAAVDGNAAAATDDTALASTSDAATTDDAALASADEAAAAGNDVPNFSADSEKMSIEPSAALIQADNPQDQPLRIELVDDPAAPAAQNITELSGMTETGADNSAAAFETNAAAVRTIVETYGSQYTITVPEALEQAEDTAPCILVIVTPAD